MAPATTGTGAPERSIYLDNAATTPLCAEAIDAMRPFMDGQAQPFGNANSLYTLGRDAFARLEDARASVAHDLGASRPDEVIFTSGATESDNAAVVGIARAALRKQRQAGHKIDHPRVVMSRIEHEAVLNTAPLLRDLGFEVDFVDNDGAGRVTPEALEEALTPDTVLASVMAANNEVGIIEPWRELAATAHRHGVLFHTDMVQALGKLPIALEVDGVDAASFSAHKVNGPKGVGILYLRRTTPFDALLGGGGQERNRRSGTQNVMGAAGTAAAIRQIVARREDNVRHMRALRDEAYERLCTIPGVSRTIAEGADHPDDFLPNIVHVSVSGWEGESLVLRLDMAGICASSGSACSTGSLDPSHVLTALGVGRKRAQGALRISLAGSTTHDDIDALIGALSDIVGR
jgi:cysteine desulfurase